MELRPKGIIIRFRSLLETYGLIIPYFKLTVYKEKTSEITLFKDHYFVRMQASSKEAKRFFKKVMDEKIRSTPPSIDLL